MPFDDFFFTFGAKIQILCQILLFSLTKAIFLKEMAPALLKEMKHSKKASLLREKNAELQNLLFNLLNSDDEENFAPWGGKRR